MAVKQMKYCKIIYNGTSRAHEGDVYSGILLRIDKEYLTAIVQGPEIHDDISEMDFPVEDWEIRESTAEDVHHYFKHSVTKSKIRMIDAEMELDHKRHILKKQKEILDEHFPPEKWS